MRHACSCAMIGAVLLVRYSQQLPLCTSPSPSVDAFLEEHRPLIEAAVAKARLGAKAAKQSETTMDRLYKVRY